MCGILFVLKKQSSKEHSTQVSYDNVELHIFETAFNLLNNRGPDSSSFFVNNNKFFGFKRLAINDLSVDGNQPFFSPSKDDYKLLSMCNGE